MEHINIVFEDDALLVIQKPNNLAVQSAAQKSLMDILSEKYKELFLVHRLDQVVGGLLVIAKTKEVANLLVKQLSTDTFQKTYLAIVPQQLPEKQAEVTDYLIHDKKRRKAYISSKRKGKKSMLSYKYLHSSDNYHLYEVELYTGRFHQIRAQLAHAGSPIRGDLKYGAKRSKRAGGIDLLAWKLAFRHPVTHKPLVFQATFPDEPIWEFFAEKMGV